MRAPAYILPIPELTFSRGHSICLDLFGGCALILHRLLESLLSLVLNHNAVRLQEVQRHSQVGLFVE